MDEDEWEEPESLQSVRRAVTGSRDSGRTPGATPLPSPRATPSDSIYGRGSNDPAERAWEADERPGRDRHDRPSTTAGRDTPFDWKKAMREDGREAAYAADRRRPEGNGGGRGGGRHRQRREVDGDEEEDYYEAFYLSEEGVAHGEEVFLGDPDKIREKEEAMLKAQERGEANLRRQQQHNSRKNQLAADQMAWEENRLLTSGVAVRNEVDTDFDDTDDSRIRLNVHHTKPPFIDGRVTFSKQLSTVPVVKEPTCDMALLSKKGSALVRDRRERRERGKMRQRFWELGGSRMGEAMGLKRLLVRRSRRC